MTVFSTPVTRSRLASSEREPSFSVTDRRLNSAEVSSRDTWTLPLSACRTARPFSPITRSQLFMPGNSDVRSISRRSIASEMAAFCSSSFLLSICVASNIREVKAVMAISTIGSLHPDSPTPLSSEESSFFIHASGERLLPVTFSSVPLYRASRSFPLCSTCCLMWPFWAISAR